MKNNKGFTLVELLAVIVVLALIIGIAVPNAISLSNRSKKKMYISKVDMIIKAAQLYGEDHPRDVAANEAACSSSGNVKVDKLVKDGKVKADNTKKNGSTILVEDPYSGTDMQDLWLCVYKANNRVYAKIICNSGKWMDNGVTMPDGYCD